MIGRIFDGMSETLSFSERQSNQISYSESENRTSYTIAHPNIGTIRELKGAL